MKLIKLAFYVNEAVVAMVLFDHFILQAYPRPFSTNSLRWIGASMAVGFVKANLDLNRMLDN